MARSNATSRRPGAWTALSDEQLLEMRVRDLGLTIEGSWLAPRINRLYAELDARGIAFHPPCYLADEWFCPDRVPVIGIPFFLAHRRLTRLERKMMLEAEGETDTWCMKLLRHEAGHALNYAHELFKRTRWRELFGPFSRAYSDAYFAQPYSKRYVNHLANNYAQAHPDEDFAETLAVWLVAGERWKAKYRDWPVIKKLRYVDHVMGRIGAHPPVVTRHELPYSAERMTRTLAQYYQRKRRVMGESFPGFYDPGLAKLFTDRPAAEAAEDASAVLNRLRRTVVNAVAAWTGERKFDIDRLIIKLARRCDALGLKVRAGETETACEVSAFVTAVMKNIHQFLEGSEKP